jgi:hypothetical protein
MDKLDVVDLYDSCDSEDDSDDFVNCVTLPKLPHDSDNANNSVDGSEIVRRERIEFFDTEIHLENIAMNAMEKLRNFTEENGLIFLDRCENYNMVDFLREEFTDS